MEGLVLIEPTDLYNMLQQASVYSNLSDNNYLLLIGKYKISVYFRLFSLCFKNIMSYYYDCLPTNDWFIATVVIYHVNKLTSFSLWFFDIIQISLYEPIILHVGGVAGIELTEVKEVSILTV